MDRVALAECSSEELADAVGQVHALECATRAALLELIVVCEERKVWAEDGCQSIESWLAMRMGIAWRSAAELVRVARACADLPAVAETLRSGAVSWDKARALATVAIPETDAEWAGFAPDMSVARLERCARSRRERDEARAARAQEGQNLCFRPDRSEPVTRIRGCVPNDVAAVIQAAVEREADLIPPNPETGEFDSYASRRAQGLYKLCSQRLGADADADRATVVIHEQADGSLTFADGSGMSPSVAERLRCDCREHRPDGSTASVISPSLRRKVLRRDGGCTFPGCEQRHWLQVHHVIHRSEQGPTVAWNLRAQCGFHHRMIHCPGWRVDWDEQGELRYFRPDGEEVKAKAPPPLDPALRERLKGWLPFRGTASPNDTS
jgi:hypothetical protein